MRSQRRDDHQQQHRRRRSRTPPRASGSERTSWRSGAATTAAGAEQKSTRSWEPRSQQTAHSQPSREQWHGRSQQAHSDDLLPPTPLHIQRQAIDAAAAAQASTASSAAAAAAASSSAKPFAFATLVMLGDDYIAGALALAHSLRAHGSAAALVALVSADVSARGRSALLVLFDEVVEVALLSGRAVHRPWSRFASGAQNGQRMYQWLTHSFTKLQALGLTQYARVCLLDADMLCVSPPDDVFAVRAPAGICSLFGEKDPAAHAAAHGQRLSEQQVRAAVERAWGMRGCLALLQPSAAHLALVRDTLLALGGYGERRLHVGADERLLSELYLDQWSHVHQRFGLTSWKSGPEYTGQLPPVFLHFVTEKPWRPAPIDAANGSGASAWPDYAHFYKTAKAIAMERPELAHYFQRHLDFMQPHVHESERMLAQTPLVSPDAASTAGHDDDTPAEQR